MAGVTWAAMLTVAAGVAMSSPASTVATPADQGSQLAAACASCHRLDGRDTGIPPVVGLDAASITQAMLAYRSGARASQIMQVVARALTPPQIASIARYLAARQPVDGP
jgi:sulfide dehydrogenase cytochrome subunit